MLAVVEGRLTCGRIAGLSCSASPCPGQTDPDICSHLAGLAAWRRLSHEEQIGKIGTPPPAIDPAVRDAVNACPSRGPVLPISMQDDCGCRGKELSECKERRGAVAGRVTLRDCLACKSRAD